MAQPSLEDVHVDAVLTNISVAYIQNQNNFISTKVFPMIPVDKKSDLYYIWTQNDWFRDEAKPRPPGTESAGSGMNLSTTNYNCNVFALHKDLDEQTLANADAPLNLFRASTEWLTQMMLLRMERQFVTDYFTTGVWDNDVTPANLWSDYANSDPVDDIELGKETMLMNTGLEATDLVLGYQTWRKLKQHPDLIDRVKYSREADSADGIMARAFGVQRILVAKSVYATNVEGATAAYDFNFGKHALLVHSAPSPGINVASAGYTFAWRGISKGLGAEVGVKRFPMVHLESERVEAQKAWDNRVVATNLGYFLSGAVA